MSSWRRLAKSLCFWSPSSPMVVPPYDDCCEILQRQLRSFGFTNPPDDIDLEEYSKLNSGYVFAEARGDFALKKRAAAGKTIVFVHRSAEENKQTTAIVIMSRVGGSVFQEGAPRPSPTLLGEISLQDYIAGKRCAAILTKCIGLFRPTQTATRKLTEEAPAF